MLRCLNDVDAVWDYQSACRTAVQLGLAAEETVADAEITRGNMAVLICHTLARLGYDVKLSETAQPNLSANGTSDAAAVQETAEPFDVAAAKQDIIDRTNALRREKGVAALTVNDKLMQMRWLPAAFTPTQGRTEESISPSRTARTSVKTSVRCPSSILRSRKQHCLSESFYYGPIQADIGKT